MGHNAFSLDPVCIQHLQLVVKNTGPPSMRTKMKRIVVLPGASVVFYLDTILFGVVLFNATVRAVQQCHDMDGQPSKSLR